MPGATMKPFVTVLCAAAGMLAGGLARAETPAYNRDIRPIFAENCFACHGPDSAARKAGLRLDSFEAATAPRDGGPGVIVPGDPAASALFHRVTTSDDADRMPPPKTKKSLKKEEIALLEQWIASGAEYEAHWSFIPPRRAPLPEPNRSEWVRNPIDAFVLARLEAAGLEPAPEADRATLARRVSLDLTGLPPTPEEVLAFEHDPSPNAYEKFVDRLLASQRYGEHRARYWLDAARYADTHGIHFDNFREMWSYREWVIDALNANMPFDQFSIEQLAGDLLPDPDLDQLIATGFNRCNMTTSEGGAIDEEYLVLYNRDRTETTSAVWLGLTANCATCHDHKFDPMTQKEFYQMAAFFNNTTQRAMDGNRKDTPPVVVVPTRQDRARWKELPELQAKAQDRVERRRQNALDDFTAWIAKADPAEILEGIPTKGLQFAAPLKEPAHPSVTVMVNGYPRTLSLGPAQEGVISASAFTTSPENVPAIPEAGDFERDQPFSFGLWVKLHPDDRNGSIIARMDESAGYRGWDLWFQDGRPATHIVHKWPDDALKVIASKAIEPNRWTHVFLTYDGSSKAGGVNIFIDGVMQDVERPADKLQNTIRAEVPLKIGQRNKGDQIENAGVQDLRIYNRELRPAEIAALHTQPRLAWLIEKPAESRTEAEQKALFDGYLAGYDAEFKAASAALASLEQEERDIQRRGTIAHIMNEKEGEPEAYVLFRGEYTQRREKVGPATPAFLPPMPEDFPRDRLGFARWLFLPEHPLTARVTVNRFWQQLFGTGIVRTPGDFGVTGESPSHPMLLDWLAVEFRDSGWDIKAFYKLMVMSATYRQAAIITPEKLEKDEQNRLFSRGPRFRMDAEMIRDYALAASGLLSPRIGGPSVRPYQPAGVWEMVAMPESNTRDYKRDSGEKLYRRSLYTFWKRSAPPASMDVFNAPSRETCTVRRERTNTPLQALATLNGPQFVEAARCLAQKALASAAESDPERLDRIARRLLAREFRPKEREVVLGVLADLRAHYKAAPEDAKALIEVGEAPVRPGLEPVQLAAYTMVVNQLMNLDEVLNK